MDKKIKSQLEADVQPEDFAQSFQPIISAIGIKAALDLCRYSGGIQQYIPLYDEVLEGPRNRAITKEFDGSNTRRLAWKYDLAESTVRKVLARNRRSENKKMLEENQESLF
ncbi:Mor transcription activator family protein [Phascolarctobacterium faecium]|uniref:Mor transcription activator family protein n=1 Tax=Phascolarctobacterium faecium TaxID=33025 RepID=UPI002FDFA537